ncbi:MAG TPA: DNA-directed RNA polymerase subunit RpoH/Rpb5 C-terminal domain-containing protein [Candidatus Norongarragalinales archaeon]|nr:DNA-directed RNA polymerase subunit RpoH/Rpb5 C-terminal domain-containing protein [Candidatus Norongarragalinales archaeon]
MDPNFSHVFLPKHTIATEEEVQEVLEKFKITKENLPLLKSEDPSAKGLGAKAGDVVKIVRPLEGGKEEFYYRQVID